MVDIDIGDYEFDQDSNGDLVIKDPNDNEVMKWDKSNGQWDFGSETLANIRVEDVADTASSNTIYDSSSETLGDGNQDVNADSVSTKELSNDSGLTQSRIPTVRTTPIIEDWERQSLNYYTLKSNDVVIETSEVLQGSASVRTNADGNHDILSSFAIDRGYRYRIYFRFDTQSSQTVQFVKFWYSLSETTAANNANGYEFEIRADSSSEIKRYDTGSSTQLASTTTNTQTDEWVVMEVDIEYDNIALRALQLDGTQDFQITANDDTHQDTGFLQLQIRSDDEANNNRTYTDAIQRRPL